MNDAARGQVVCSVLERDVVATAARIAAAPAGCGLVEIRADHMRVAEVAGLVRRAGRDTIVTVRRVDDGGAFDGSEVERRALLDAALAAGARYVDVEAGLPVAELAEGEAAGRVILSHHGAPCRREELQAVLQRLAGSRAAQLKLVPVAERVAEVAAVRELLQSVGAERRLACFALGRAGALSRIAAIGWGSWATYGSTVAGAETAAGQFTARDLLDVYDVQGIGAHTAFFALIGSHVFRSPSPAMHAAGYRYGGLDARYVPLEMDDPADLVGLQETHAVPLRGFAVTMPFKGAMAARCGALDAIAARADAVNTVLPGDGEWSGFNTDGRAAVACVRRQVDPANARVAVLGAGGTARAVAAALREAGADVTLFAREAARVTRAFAALGLPIEPWENAERATWDVLVNATPLGSGGEQALAESSLTGRVVLDAVYGKAATPLITSAGRRGLATVDGFELLVEQALLQFERLTARRPDRETLRSAGREWLDAQAE